MKRSLIFVENITRWIGSVTSVIVHTTLFIGAFVVGLVHLAAWDSVLLILTTIVSLEAIYLAIFIQISVNQNTESLREVEEDVDEIQKDIDAIEQDVDEIQEGDAEEERHKQHQTQMLHGISERLQKIIKDIDNLQ
jgi:peptidoglycan hydrolase CwlO-like protein